MLQDHREVIEVALARVQRQQRLIGEKYNDNATSLVNLSFRAELDAIWDVLKVFAKAADGIPIQDQVLEDTFGKSGRL